MSDISTIKKIRLLVTATVSRNANVLCVPAVKLLIPLYELLLFKNIVDNVTNKPYAEDTKTIELSMPDYQQVISRIDGLVSISKGNSCDRHRLCCPLTYTCRPTSRRITTVRKITHCISTVWCRIQIGEEIEPSPWSNDAFLVVAFYEFFICQPGQYIGPTAFTDKYTSTGIKTLGANGSAQVRVSCSEVVDREESWGVCIISEDELIDNWLSTVAGSYQG